MNDATHPQLHCTCSEEGTAACPHPRPPNVAVTGLEGTREVSC